MLKHLLVLALLAVGALARPNWRELNDYSFDKFVRDYDLRIAPNSKEYQLRKEIFETELARVQAHNAAGNSWKEGINKYSAMTPEEKKASFGFNAGAASVHAPAFLKTQMVQTPVEELPKHVDWREAGIVTPVKDQGRCGSCWAFASTAVIESHVAKHTGLLFDLSVQQVTSCAPNPRQCGGSGKCQGSTSQLAFDYVAASNGLLSEYQYSYSSYYGTEYECAVNNTKTAATISGYVQLPRNDHVALMKAVATVGPIAVTVDASAWHSYESGIFNGCNQTTPHLNHAVVLVGYGEEDGEGYWLVRNSWSPTWGEKGYIRLYRPTPEKESCGINTDPHDGIACAGDNTPQYVCGTCGVVFDSAYPSGAVALNN
eukprot:Colp12_sorted_trinity150504_noHs@2815